METGTTYECNKLYNISLTDLEPDPNQPRKHLDNDTLKELTSSIAEHGIIEPILFRRENGQNYIVVGKGVVKRHGRPDMKKYQPYLSTAGTMKKYPLLKT